MSGTSNTMAPPQDPVVIAFYTIGDSRSVPDATMADGSSATGSDWFRCRALTLATNSSYVFGVNSLSDATTALQNLPATLKIKKAYFYGHGNETGFMLACSPMGSDNYQSNSWQYLVDPNCTDPTVPTSSARDSTDFFNLLVTHLAPDFQIGFLGCHMGVSFVPALAKTLSGKGVSGKVVGYKNTYEAHLQNPSLGLDDPNQKFADWLMDDSDKTGKKAKSKVTNNELPRFDSTATISP